MSKSNVLFKYADDTNLLCPEKTDVDLWVELQNIINWASASKMKLNLSKTKELVFRRPRYSVALLPPLVPDIDRVTEAKR